MYHYIALLPLATRFVFDLVSPVKSRRTKDGPQPQNVEVFQLLQFLAVSTLTLGPFLMTGREKFLRGHVMVVDQSHGEVALVPTIVIRTALSEVVTQARPPMFLFLWVVACGTVRCKPSHRGLAATCIYFTAGHILDHIDEPADFIPGCPVVSQVAVDLVLSSEVVGVNRCGLLHVAAETTPAAIPVFVAVP